MPETDPVPPPERKPWPMSWVVIAIVAYIVIYTSINLGFRKPGPGHEPAAEARAHRRHFIQASMSGWTRYGVHFGMPAPEPGADAEISRQATPENLAEAVPVDLTMIFPGKPSMHAAPASIRAPAVLPADGVLRVQLHFGDLSSPASFGEALAYARDQHLRLFLQDEERTPVDEDPVPAAPEMEIHLPARVLAAGDWQVTLYTKDVIFNWGFVVPAALAATPTAAETPAP